MTDQNAERLKIKLAEIEGSWVERNSTSVVQFLLDGSGSINDSQFRLMIGFVSTIIGRLPDENENLMSILQFSDTVQNVCTLTKSKQDLAAALLSNFNLVYFN